jgi:hypothetical protein
MKRIILTLMTGLMALTFSVYAQGPNSGRGTCPDADKDGKCDRCGRATGSGKQEGRGHQHRGGGCCGKQQGKAAAPAKG